MVVGVWIDLEYLLSLGVINQQF